MIGPNQNMVGEMVWMRRPADRERQRKLALLTWEC